MRLSQKRTCNGCLAEENQHCVIGFHTAIMPNNGSKHVPIEPCPKPITKDALKVAKIIGRRK
jgi:hypothetical protein